MNTAEIKTGATIKLVRDDFEDNSYLDRIGVLERFEDNIMGGDSADANPIRVHNGTVLSVSDDGSEATIELDKYDAAPGAHEDGLGKVRTVGSEYLFVV